MRAPSDYQPSMEEVLDTIRRIIGEWGDDEPDEEDVDVRCERALDEIRTAVSALQTGNVIFAADFMRSDRRGRSR